MKSVRDIVVCVSTLRFGADHQTLYSMYNVIVAIPMDFPGEKILRTTGLPMRRVFFRADRQPLPQCRPNSLKENTRKLNANLCTYLCRTRNCCHALRLCLGVVRSTFKRRKSQLDKFGTIRCWFILMTFNYKNWIRKSPCFMYRYLVSTYWNNNG